jgi:hypothetical protein
LGVFNRSFAERSAKGPRPERLRIDATHLQAHRTAASLPKKGALPGRIGRTRGGLTSRLHDVRDETGRNDQVGLPPFIPPRASRKVQIDYDRTLYRQHHRIENMFGRLKDWRRIHSRCER